MSLFKKEETKTEEEIPLTTKEIEQHKKNVTSIRKKYNLAKKMCKMLKTRLQDFKDEWTLAKNEKEQNKIMKKIKETEDLLNQRKMEMIKGILASGELFEITNDEGEELTIQELETKDVETIENYFEQMIEELERIT